MNRLACWVSVTLSIASPALAGSYVRTEISIPGQTGPRPTGINKGGQVVLQVDSKGHPGPLYYVWRSGASKPLGRPAILENPTNVTDLGLAVGMSYTGTTSDPVNAYIVNVDTNKLTQLPAPAGYYPIPYAVNAGGTVVGIMEGAGLPTKSYVYSGGQVTEILCPGSTYTVPSVINDEGDIAGVCGVETSSAVTRHPFLYKNGVYQTTTLPGTVSVTGIDAIGHVVGDYAISNQYSTVSHGFIFNGEKTTVLNYPGSSSTVVNGIGPRGEVVGHFDFDTAPYGQHGFILAGGAYKIVDVPGQAYLGSDIIAINKGGSFISTYIDGSNQYHAYVGTCPAGQAPCQ